MPISFVLARRALPLWLFTCAACASEPSPPSRSADDPSNPRAAETPFTPPPATSANAASEGPVTYVCPMHPEVTSREPGHVCPKCGMALVPRRAP